MTAGYWTRLVWMSAAVYAAVEIAVWVAARVLAGAAARRAARMEARRGERLMLALGLGPVTLGAAAALGLCVPSYLMFEGGGSEGVGAVCIALALAGAARIAIGVLNAARAWRHAHLWHAELRREGAAEHGVLVVDRPGGIVALTGVMRPRLVVSRIVLDTLSVPEWSMARAHEWAHARAWDNAKRLALAAAPGARTAARVWARMAERAADEAATGADPGRRAALASALVKVAQLGLGPSAGVASTLASEADELAARVHRLLDQPERGRPLNWRWKAAGVLAVSAAVANPAAQALAHEIFEKLLR